MQSAVLSCVLVFACMVGIAAAQASAPSDTMQAAESSAPELADVSLDAGPCFGSAA